MLPFTDIHSVKNYFLELGFHAKIRSKIHNHQALIIELEFNQNVMLIVFSHYSKSRFDDESLILKSLRGDVRYIMFLDTNTQVGMFVKRTLSLTTTLKKQTYPFKFSSQEAQLLLGSLKPGFLNTFEDPFNIEKIVKSFYPRYEKQLLLLSNAIRGINNDYDKTRYADILMSRLMFLQFLQSRNFFQDRQFLLNHVDLSSDNSYYEFLCTLFFDVLNIPTKHRKNHVSHYKNIGFLNGGLFKKHNIECNYKISIPNKILQEILTFLKNYNWYVDETSVSTNTINPVVLGHIFEQTISNQRKKGAYYTPIDVTQFICYNTIIPYCVDRINLKFNTNYENLPTSDSISRICANSQHAKYLYFNVLKPLTILDNACGSGAFLLTAFGLLFDLYQTVWDSISKINDPLINYELETIKRQPSTKYYFRKRVVTENLFGVDMDEGAIEVCRLRLWLNLVADMDLQNPEPLPNIDYNILPGNSLLGFVNSPSIQTDLKSEIPTTEDYEQITKLKKDYSSAVDPKQANAIKSKLDPIIFRCREQLTHVLSKSKRKNHTTQLIHQPFHWLVEFPFIIRENHGFDIIVGNPPYIEKNAIDYWLQFKLYACGNTYAYFIERSLHLLKRNGKLGYIVPLSCSSTSRMSSLITHMTDNCSQIFFSHYDDRPSKLFDGLDPRSTIFLCTVSDTNCSVYTTGYKRWRKANRPDLFNDVLKHSTDSTKFVMHPRLDDVVPKIDSRTEIRIFKKLISKSESISHCVVNPSAKIDPSDKYPVYYHNAPRYWIRALNSNIPLKRIVNNITYQEISPQIKTIYCESKNTQTILTGLLNSTLFYWWWIKLSDCRHLINSTITRFPIDLSILTQDTLTMKNLNTVVNLLHKDYQNHITYKNYQRRNSILKVPEYHPHKSKHIINKLDDIFAKHYNFTHVELDFIKQFDIEFRNQ